MNLIDLIIIAIVLFSVWIGYQKGFVLGTVQLITWLGSLIAGYVFYQYVAVFLQRFFPALNVWTLPVAFILTVILSRIILSLLMNRVAYNTPDRVHQNPANRFLGIVPGFFNGMVNAVILAALLFAMPLWEGLTAKTQDSQIANRLAVHAEWLNEKLAPIFNDAIKRSMNKLTVEPKSEETVKLHFTVKTAKPRPDLEAKMLEMVNAERKKVGRSPLKADPEMKEVARAHSKDMFERGYFSHYTPEKKDPFDRMKASGVKFLTAGENLAFGKTLAICHQGLMNSPGHKANILQPAFGRLGIGILDGGVYGLMISQEFRN
jgi:uncharacterized protein YkwD